MLLHVSRRKQLLCGGVFSMSVEKEKNREKFVLCFHRLFHIFCFYYGILPFFSHACQNFFIVRKCHADFENRLHRRGGRAFAAVAPPRTVRRSRADGVFGGATKSALQAFQRTHGLTPDGIFGAETERALAPWLRGYAVHTVRPGDTLFSLAERYDASLGAIETANPALDPFALRPGQRITVPLPFSVVPTDIPWCSALMDCAVDGLTHRYPQLRAESIGRSALSRPIWALTAGDGCAACSTAPRTTRTSGSQRRF